MNDDLRKAAEARLPVKSEASSLSADELLHELQVHQIELERQNESLRLAQIEMEESRDRYADLYDFAPVAYLSVSREGMISEANLECAALLGVARGKLLRLRFDRFVAAKDDWQQFFLHLLKSDKKLTLELVLKRPDGTTFDARLDGLPVLRGDCAVRLTLTDNTERNRAETARQKLLLLEEREITRQKLEYAYGEWINALDAVNDPIFIHDQAFRILRCNKAYQRCAQLPFKQIIGQPYYEIFPVTHEPMYCCSRAMGRSAGKAEEELVLGDAVYRTRAFVIRDEQGGYLYSVHVMEEITERKRLLQLQSVLVRISTVFALITDEERYNEVLKLVLEVMGSPFGVFGYIDTDGALVVPTMTRQVWDRCNVPEKSIRFPRQTWGDSSWPRAIREKRGNCSNEISTRVPEGHVSIQRNIAMPILYRGEVIGLFQVANKATDYIQADIALLQTIADNVAPLLYAQLQQGRTMVTLAHANRVLAARSRVNLSLVHAGSEAELMNEICQAIVEQSGYRMAWVGYVRNDENKSIEVMAHAGRDEGYLDSAQLIWAETERGMGPSGRAVRSGKTQVCQDIRHDPDYLPWRDAAIAHGYAASIALPLFDAENAVFGLLDVYSDRVNAFTPEEIGLLEEMAQDMSFGVSALRTSQERNRALELNRKQLLQLQDNLEDTVNAIATIVELRDPYTAGHQRRVADIACAIAGKMGLSDERVHGLHIASLVHDLGKIQIPAEMLSKPGRLSEIEYKLIKVHPRAGCDILKGIDFPWPVAEIVLQHHERVDGSGYPQGLGGDDILLEARILCVADVIEAMASHRPYRPGLGIDAALAEIVSGRGTRYDSDVVDACVALFRDGYELAR